LLSAEGTDDPQWREQSSIGRASGWMEAAALEASTQSRLQDFPGADAALTRLL